MPFLTLLALAASPSDILVTASRAPVVERETAVSATVLDAQRIEALGETQTIDLLRSVPGLAIAVSGARGSQAQVRIRGAEANHSLLFIDGIAFNDPAAGNEPRFETLVADGLARIEVVRGPQSALWGSEAIGGVIALDSPEPGTGPRVTATGEYGGRDSLRASGSAAIGGERAGAVLSAAHIESDGIDILGGGDGDRDGFRNTTLALKSVARPGNNAEIGLAARYIDAFAAFDGTDPVTFLRADTADTSTTRTGAVRAHATIGTDAEAPWRATIEGQYLTSRNRNFNAGAPLNRTSGDRFRVSAQAEARIGTRHRLIGAVEREDESFHARDQQYFGGTDQDRTRGRTAFVGEWRADWSDIVSTDLALRHDDFSRFADATTVRAGAVARIGGGVSLTGSYGEGVAQPTFVDLYGFFPGSFVGNPTLRPETSRGYEIGARWESKRASVAIVGFDNRLKNEIVSTFDSATFLSSTANASGRSKWRGIELSGSLRPVEGLRIDAGYTFLDAKDQQIAGDVRLKEVRRPKHSASFAFDYAADRLLVGGSIDYVGKRRDSDFDIFQDVTLDDYVLASLRVGYRLTEALEAFGRIDNAFDADYRDVVGYNTPGRTVYAGLRIRLGD